MLGAIPQIIDSVAAAYGCTSRLSYPEVTVYGEPSDITEKVRLQAVDFLGEAAVATYPVRMTAEDFGFSRNGFLLLLPVRCGPGKRSLREAPLLHLSLTTRRC